MSESNPNGPDEPSVTSSDQHDDLVPFGDGGDPPDAEWSEDANGTVAQSDVTPVDTDADVVAFVGSSENDAAWIASDTFGLFDGTEGFYGCSQWVDDAESDDSDDRRGKVP